MAWGARRQSTNNGCVCAFLLIAPCLSSRAPSCTSQHAELAAACMGNAAFHRWSIGFRASIESLRSTIGPRAGQPCWPTLCLPLQLSHHFLQTYFCLATKECAVQQRSQWRPRQQYGCVDKSGGDRFTSRPTLPQTAAAAPARMGEVPAAPQRLKPAYAWRRCAQQSSASRCRCLPTRCRRRWWKRQQRRARRGPLQGRQSRRMRSGMRLPRGSWMSSSSRRST
jgi:hypothetical protein